MVIAQAAAEYGALAGFAKVIDYGVATFDGFINQLEPSTWVWAVLALFALRLVLRPSR